MFRLREQKQDARLHLRSRTLAAGRTGRTIRPPEPNLKVCHLRGVDIGKPCIGLLAHGPGGNLVFLVECTLSLRKACTAYVCQLSSSATSPIMHTACSVWTCEEIVGIRVAIVN